MAKYRYVGPDVRWIDLGGVAPVKTEPGDIVDIDDKKFAVQDGSKGERVLFEKISAAKKVAKKEEE